MPGGSCLRVAYPNWYESAVLLNLHSEKEPGLRPSWLVCASRLTGQPARRLGSFGMMGQTGEDMNTLLRARSEDRGTPEGGSTR